MRSALLRSVAVGIAAVGMTITAYPALANPFLPGLVNLNFLSYSGSPPKNYFNSVNPTGWTGGSGLIFITAPGTSASSPTTACGPTYLSTYGCPSNLSIPGGYNEVEADGNPIFESGFNYMVNGLTSGQTYTLSFYQAASQQVGFIGNTTEQWIVSLGQSGLTTCIGCGPFNSTFGSFESTYSNADASASVVATPLMSTPSGGMTDWNYVTVNLKADGPSALLSFLAWGDEGTTNNLPPMVFLAGVNSPSGENKVPEPATLSLFGVGLLGFGGAWLRRRNKRKAAV
jgi:PEP-CTERM motif